MQVNVNNRMLIQQKFDKGGDEKSHFPLNIYLCWLLAWCGTLAYQDGREKEFLAEQAKNVLSKLFFSFHKVENSLIVEIIEIIMDSAFKYGTESMVRLFYDLYFEDFKLVKNPNMIYWMANATGRG